MTSKPTPQTIQRFQNAVDAINAVDDLPFKARDWKTLRIYIESKSSPRTFKSVAYLHAKPEDLQENPSYPLEGFNLTVNSTHRHASKKSRTEAEKAYAKVIGENLVKYNLIDSKPKTS